MRLKKVRIKRYQCFADSGEIEFQDGINLIVGQNNSGKSSLLRALLAQGDDDRHRTPDKYLAHRLGTAQIRFSFEVAGEELLNAILRGSKRTIPTSQIDAPKAKIELDALFSKLRLPIDILKCPPHSFRSEKYPTLGNAVPKVSRSAQVQPSGDGTFYVGLVTANPIDDVPEIIQEMWFRESFFFAAERHPRGESPHQNIDRLDPAAEKLPAVLDTLNGSRGDIFKTLVDHLREIFPSVGNLSIRPHQTATNINEIRIWPTKEMKHVELSFPLMASGTGVAQAIAILTAIMTIEKAVIIIDEINSFLHPAAVKSLLRIIQTYYSHHQYIISTHSPEVIAFSNCKSLHLVKRNGYESTVKLIDLEDVNAFNEVAAQLGISMADVFAADKIIWVEGATEELCFPYIYNQTEGPLPPGLTIKSVVATGDFIARERDRKLIYNIYQRLSAATARLTVSVAFSFDNENLSAKSMSEMNRESQGRLRFLPRRHLECYFVDPDAIAAFINDRLDSDEPPIVSDDIAFSIGKVAGQSDFNIKSWNGDIKNVEWLSQVDAANLIKAVCQKVSDCRVTFNKKHDSPFLLKFLCANKPENLTDLSSHVKKLVEFSSST